MTITKYENKIPKGYVIEITSWENDGDFYNTKKLTGLGQLEFQWHVQFLEFMFEAQKKDSDRSISEVMLELYEDNPEKYRELKDFIPPKHNDYAEFFTDLFCELEYAFIGYSDPSVGGSRILESFTSYYLPTDLEIAEYY